MAGMERPGHSQIIGGKSYAQYSPEWYAAMEADKTREAEQKGVNAGTAAGSAITTLRSSVPDLFGNGSSSSSSSSSSGAAGGIAPRATFPTDGGGGGGSVFPGGPVGGVPMGGAPSLSPVDTSAADAAQFARAKDKIGDVTRGSLTGLRSALGGRGQLGGGGELRGTSSVLNKGAQGLGEVARDQAIQNVEGERERTAMKYQGDIALRGQDISASQAANALAARLKEVQYQGDITQRGQDLAASNAQSAQQMSQQQQQQQMLDRILSALNPLY